ncbi:YbaB/EbfC family nucleoid-associated protein [Kibdelosporangium phytohabitans]|uniref:YbaB/EbfC DNA-binding family protein n=1 Tax=Kibdelosporangium phytohabitans TaxID=860235 RepID=A0A0N9IA49_9PSEU|nr:hypothetical protein AOZ06_46050 [Kibdelosporangium phytohabitans]MBE1465023.1 DNA-binding protein YbaB [Kibdelosporangium phytohabitans]
MSADMERLVAEFEKFQAKIKTAEAKFGGVGEMQDQLAQLEVAATSPDRSIRVTAAAGGTVTGIQLTPEAMRQSAPALAAAIMSTLRAAVAESARRQAAIVDETVGSAFGVTISDQVENAQVMGTVTQEPPSQREERRPLSSDDDEPGEDTIFRQPRY